VIYDGVLSNTHCYYQTEKKPYFLFAGRLEKAKGILPLIDAYANYCRLHPLPLPLYIAGSGTESYTQLVKDKITQHAIEHNVQFLGMRDDILSLYKEATALVVPSISEGFGFITAEAMFSGCLVIGNDTAGTKEQFDNGKEITGQEIALRYNTQEQLTQHLMDVTNKTINHYEPMILRAQQVVSQLYSTEAHVKNIYRFYHRILN
jgi:glycosyltransferase involved in cell wall biosynthesis